MYFVDQNGKQLRQENYVPYKGQPVQENFVENFSDDSKTKKWLMWGGIALGVILVVVVVVYIVRKRKADMSVGSSDSAMAKFGFRFY